MPDVSGSPALDVAIGLIFLLFLLSILCSTVNETIATVLSWRARFLEEGIRSMLGADTVDPEQQATTARWLRELAEHPLIRGKVEKPAGMPAGRAADRSGLSRLIPHRPSDQDFPSYLQPETFALAFLDTVAPPEPGGGNVIARAEALLSQLPEHHPARRTFVVFLDRAEGDVQRFREGVERWFDNTMERVSGWYRRRVQIALAVIATVITLLFNADALQIGRALWTQETLRASVVAQAQKAVSDGTAAPDVGRGAAGEQAETLTEQVRHIDELQLPLGWSFDPDDPRWFDSVGGLLGKIAGLASTIAALTLGAPFWFDLLGRVARLRTTGRPPEQGKA